MPLEVYSAPAVMEVLGEAGWARQQSPDDFAGASPAAPARRAPGRAAPKAKPSSLDAQLAASIAAVAANYTAKATEPQSAAPSMLALPAAPRVAQAGAPMLALPVPAPAFGAQVLRASALAAPPYQGAYGAAGFAAAPAPAPAPVVPDVDDQKLAELAMEAMLAGDMARYEAPKRTRVIKPFGARALVCCGLVDAKLGHEAAARRSSS